MLCVTIFIYAHYPDLLSPGYSRDVSTERDGSYIEGRRYQPSVPPKHERDQPHRHQPCITKADCYRADQELVSYWINHTTFKACVRRHRNCGGQHEFSSKVHPSDGWGEGVSMQCLGGRTALELYNKKSVSCVLYTYL